MYFEKFLKNSIKLLRSPFPVILESCSRRELKRHLGTQRALQRHLGTQGIWALGHLRLSGTQRALGHSGTQTALKALGYLGTWAPGHSGTWAMGHSKSIWAPRLLGTRGTQDTLFRLYTIFISINLKTFFLKAEGSIS